MPSSSNDPSPSQRSKSSSHASKQTAISEKPMVTNDTPPSFEQRMTVTGLERNEINPRIGLVESRARIPMLAFPRALGWSTGLHIAIPPSVYVLFVIAAILLSWLAGINIWDWFKPKPEKADMVFVLVNDKNQKPPEKPLFRGEFNQHAGGKRQTDDEIRPPEKIAPDSKSLQQQARPQQQATPPRPAIQPKPQQQATPPQPEPKRPQPKQAQKTPPMPTPTFKPSIPMPTKMAKTPQQQSPTGPIAQASPRQASQASPASNPAPIQISSQGSVGLSSSASMGNRTRGNPQGGSGEAGVDVMSDENFGALVADLQRRIKRNWNPPRGMASKRIEAKIILARDGHVVKCTIVHSSGDPLADDAAIRAVEVSAPFRAFPPQIREDQVPILFTFDYTVMMNGAQRRPSPWENP